MAQRETQNERHEHFIRVHHADEHDQVPHGAGHGIQQQTGEYRQTVPALGRVSLHPLRQCRLFAPRKNQKLCEDAREHGDHDGAPKLARVRELPTREQVDEARHGRARESEAQHVHVCENAIAEFAGVASVRAAVRRVAAAVGVAEARGGRIPGEALPAAGRGPLRRTLVEIEHAAILVPRNEELPTLVRRVPLNACPRLGGVLH
mmetsp:Transcript_88465/g.255152  ORF Transcript_88465/g.255152 Transcript_88465/m.255152 type:complete len:205 (-) Transcript_88465:1505-2119(-)